MPSPAKPPRPTSTPIGSPSAPALKAGGRWRILVGLSVVSAVFVASSWLPLHVVGRARSSAGPATTLGETAGARRALGERGAADAGLTAAGAGVHGRVTKAGPVNPANWHADYTMDRRLAFAGWLGARGLSDPAVPSKEVEEAREAGAVADPTSPPPVFPSCHIFVNHCYRIIYVRHAKAASTSLLDYFGYCTGGATSRNSTCLERMDLGPNQRITQDELQALWADYFVFSFVRNPYSRFVSTYVMLMRAMLWEEAPEAEQAAFLAAQQQQQQQATGGAGAATSVKKGQQQQLRLAAWQQQQEEQEGDEAGTAGAAAGRPPKPPLRLHRFKLETARHYTWDQFCADPASFQPVCNQDPRCRGRTTKHTAAHLQAQLPCLTTPQGGWAVDFIGRVENIHSDLDALIAALDARGLEGVPQLGPRKSKLLNINGQPCHPQDAATLLIATPKEYYCDREAYFSGRHASCAAAAWHYYRADIEALGFPPQQAQQQGSSGGSQGDAAPGADS